MSSHTCKVKTKVRGVDVKEGAGVKVHRLIGTRTLDHIDPFVLLDEFKSANPEDYIAGFPMHPHRGIETITYMIKGAFRHEDSKGNGGLLTDGCVQWMTAGRGILHSEMPERTKGLLWGYQLWLSLPAKDKMIPPRYQHLSPEDIPTVEDDGMFVKIISGSYHGTTGPATNWVNTHYFDVAVDKGQVFEFPIDPKMNSFCYVHTGSVLIDPHGDPHMVHEKELAELDNNDMIEIKGVSDKAGFLLLSAYPNNEPIVKGGPFVMNSTEEIARAFVDYQNGVLDK